MNVFVIGLGGYLGSQLQHYVLKNKLPLNLIAYDRNKNGFPDWVHSPAEKVRLLLNLGSPNDWIARDEGSNYLYQVGLWKRIFENAADQVRPTRVIHLSTIHIINKNNSLTLDPYVLSHIECLDNVRKYCSSNKIFLQTVYASNIFGTLKSGMMPRENLILNKAIISLLSNKPIKLNNNGSAVRNFLWIGDFISNLTNLFFSNNLTEEIVLASEESLEIKLALKVLHKHLAGGLNFEDWCFFGGEHDGATKDAGNIRRLESECTSFESSCKLQANIFFG
jgi:nucleoside-diphosphate-sugar epimerase